MIKGIQSVTLRTVDICRDGSLNANIVCCNQCISIESLMFKLRLPLIHVNLVAVQTFNIPFERKNRQVIRPTISE